MTGFEKVLYDFLKSTSYEMTPPKAYGPFHLTFALVGFAVAFFLAWRLRHIDRKKGRILLFCIGVFLLLCEVYKQLFHYYCYGDIGYEWWIFPFQLCSVPMYLCLIAPVIRQGKISNGMYNFMMIYNLLGGFITFFEPSGINLEYWSLTLHSYTWHITLVFIGLFLTFSGFGGRTIKDYWSATVTFLVMCVIAFCINVLLFDTSGGHINMFFVGPRDSNLIIFKDISETCGWYVSTMIYIPVVCLGAFGVFLPSYLLAKRNAGKMPAAE